jgi:hypothetical protein
LVTNGRFSHFGGENSSISCKLGLELIYRVHNATGFACMQSRNERVLGTRWFTQMQANPML